MIPYLAHVVVAGLPWHAQILAKVASGSKTTTKKPSSSGSILFILIIVLLGGYLWIRSQRNRARNQQVRKRDVSIGDEISTTSGIIGRVVDLSDDRVELEIAPGTVISVMRQAVGRVLDSPSGTFGSGETFGSSEDDDQGGDDANDYDAASLPGALPELHAPDELERHEHPDATDEDLDESAATDGVAGARVAKAAPLNSDAEAANPRAGKAKGGRAAAGGSS